MNTKFRHRDPASQSSMEFEAIVEALKADSATEGLTRKNLTEVHFQKTLYPENEGQLPVHYTLRFYPDIHRIDIRAVPLPAIQKWTAVTVWLMKKRNEEYRREYGPTMEYRTDDGNIALYGKTAYSGSPASACEALLRRMDRSLAADCPHFIDIYLGIIPDDVRKPLTEEIKIYQSEL